MRTSDGASALESLTDCMRNRLKISHNWIMSPMKELMGERALLNMHMIQSRTCFVSSMEIQVCAKTFVVY